jgi:hypothetical protein
VPLFRPDAKATFHETFDRLDPADQQEVQYLVNLLCIDPRPDGRSRRAIDLPGGTVLFADTESHWVSYQIAGSDELHLIACGKFR